MPTYTFDLPDFVLAMAYATDLVCSEVANHHKRVAYIAGGLAGELGISADQKSSLVIAAALHDVGAFSLEERVGLNEFEVHEPHRHAELGFRLLGRFAPFEQVAQIIRCHHVPWRYGQGRRHAGLEVAELSHVLHLADRIEVLLEPGNGILNQAREIRDQIVSMQGTLFKPEHVEAFVALAKREHFWLDAATLSIDEVLRKQIQFKSLELDSDSIVEMSRMLSHVVDFKSPFTSSHTAGVAHTAVYLAGQVGFDAVDQERMLIAGYLHDLGKLAVPGEILQKPKPLTLSESNVMRGHTYFTRRILQTLTEFEDITEWAANHHECLSGAGYPYHLTARELSTGSRIMAAADVFVAVTEDRPYRNGMSFSETTRVLNGMVKAGKLDGDLVNLLIDDFDTVYQRREDVQQDTCVAYGQLVCDLPSS